MNAAQKAKYDGIAGKAKKDKNGKPAALFVWGWIVSILGGMPEGLISDMVLRWAQRAGRR